MAALFDSSSHSPSQSSSSSSSSDSSGSTWTPEAVVTQIKQLQDKQLLLLASKNKLDTQNKLQLTQIKDEHLRLQKLTQQRKEQALALSEVEQTLSKTKRNLAVVTKQRDGFKSILDSYDEDDALGSHDTQRMAHMQEQSRQLTQANQDLAQARQEGAQYEAELKAMNVHLARAESENAIMLQKLANGEFDPRTTKVLHMTFNPAQQAQLKLRTDRANQLASLQEEIWKLKQALLLAQGGTQGVNSPNDPKSSPGGIADVSMIAANGGIHIFSSLSVCVT